MEKLVIYYSNSGNSEKVSKVLEEKGYDLRKIEAKRELPKKFFFKVLLGGMLSGMGHRARLKEFDYDIDKYDEIVFVTPIWNGTVSCPMLTVLYNIKLEGKKASFILVSGSGEGKKARELIETNATGSKIIFLKEPLKYPDELKKLEEF